MKEALIDLLPEEKQELAYARYYLIEYQKQIEEVEMQIARYNILDRIFLN